MRILFKIILALVLAVVLSFVVVLSAVSISNLYEATCTVHKHAEAIWTMMIVMLAFTGPFAFGAILPNLFWRHKDEKKS